jgi:hypothetical protein
VSIGNAYCLLVDVRGGGLCSRMFLLIQPSYLQPGLRRVVQVGEVFVPVLTAEDVIDLAE